MRLEDQIPRAHNTTENKPTRGEEGDILGTRGAEHLGGQARGRAECRAVPPPTGQLKTPSFYPNPATRH